MLLLRTISKSTTIIILFCIYFNVPFLLTGSCKYLAEGIEVVFSGYSYVRVYVCVYKDFYINLMINIEQQLPSCLSLTDTLTSSAL